MQEIVFPKRTDQLFLGATQLTRMSSRASSCASSATTSEIEITPPIQMPPPPPPRSRLSPPTGPPAPPTMAARGTARSMSDVVPPTRALSVPPQPQSQPQPTTATATPTAATSTRAAMPPPKPTTTTTCTTMPPTSLLKLIGSGVGSKSGSVGSKLGSVELLFGPELYTELSSGDASGENYSDVQPSDQEQQLQLPVPGRRPIHNHIRQIHDPILLASQHASKGRRQQRTTGQPPSKPPGQPLLASNVASDREHQRQLRVSMPSPSQSPRLHSTTSHMYTRRSIPPTMAAGTSRLSDVEPPAQALEQAYVNVPPQRQPEPQPQPTTTAAASRTPNSPVTRCGERYPAAATRTPNSPVTPTPRAVVSATLPPSIFCSVNLHGAQHDAIDSTAPGRSPSTAPSIAHLGSSRAAAAPYPPFTPSYPPFTPSSPNFDRSSNLDSNQSVPLYPGVRNGEGVVAGVRNGEGVVVGVRAVSRAGHASPARPSACAHPQTTVHEMESPSWSPPNTGPISWALPNMGLPESQLKSQSRATFMGQMGLPDLPNMGLPNFDHFVNFGRSLVGGRSMTPPTTTTPAPKTTPSPMSASASARVARATSTHLDRRQAGMRIACGGQLSPAFKSNSPRYARR